MNDVFKRRERVYQTMESPVDQKQPGTTAHSSASVASPLWRVSPKHNGSTLYDSYELQAVTKQINKAIHGSNYGSLSPYSCYLKKSPFYCQRLDSIHKENAKTPRRISSRHANSTAVDDEKRSGRGTGRFVVRLWKKIKHGFLWNKKRQ